MAEMINPLSVLNIFGESIKNWLPPIAIIAVLLIILLIIKSVQKRAREKNLNSIRKY